MPKLYMLKSTKDFTDASFILQSDSYIMVIDGGFSFEADYLHDMLIALGGTVNAWFLTHAHDDHIGALCSLLDIYDDISVEKVYYNFPSDEFLFRYENEQTFLDTPQLITSMRNALSNHKVSEVIVKTGDCYCFPGFSVRILRTPDESITTNPINNASCVYRVEMNESGLSILFLGDLGVEGGTQLLGSTPSDLLKADYLQMAHHGQNGVSRDVYAAIRPRFCLWCTPLVLWENMGPGGYDTGPFQTVIVRGWISELRCVERHYCMFEGTHVIEI